MHPLQIHWNTPQLVYQLFEYDVKAKLLIQG